MSTKICSKCARELPTSQFGRDASRKDGLRYWCLRCYDTRTRERYREHGNFKGRYTVFNGGDWTGANIGWLAGLIEGEGCFTKTPAGLPVLSVQMTDVDVLQRAMQIAGAGSLCGPFQPKERHWKPTYTWAVRNHIHALGLMWLLLPHMGQRRTQRIIELVAERDTWGN